MMPPPYGTQRNTNQAEKLSWIVAQALLLLSSTEVAHLLRLTPGASASWQNTPRNIQQK